jgi:hypothetical protein
MRAETRNSNVQSLVLQGAGTLQRFETQLSRGNRQPKDREEFDIFHRKILFGGFLGRSKAGECYPVPQRQLNGKGGGSKFPGFPRWVATTNQRCL